MHQKAAIRVRDLILVKIPFIRGTPLFLESHFPHR